MKDYKYRDGFAYKMYQKAEENLESGVAVEELVEKILKEIINAVSFGRKKTWFPHRRISFEGSKWSRRSLNRYGI